MRGDVLPVWRLPGYFRVVAVVGFGPLGVLLVIGAVYSPGTWMIYPCLAAVIFTMLGMVRRRCTLTTTALIAQGRFVRREIPLAELTQVAQDLANNVFVCTRTARFNGGNTCLLEMIPSSRAEMSGTPGRQAVLRIRDQAEVAGATLQPLPDAGVRTGSRKPLLFSG